MTDKPTWVFVAGPYRSGSTTQYQITRDIVEETDNGIGIGYHTEKKLKEHDKPGPRFVVCKVFEFLPESFKGEESYGKRIHADGRLMSVVSVRDPRDIMVSMRKRANARGDSFHFNDVATRDFPVWLRNVEKWIGSVSDKSHWSRFEDFTLNLLRETKAIADHLSIELDHKHAKTIAGRYTIRAQQDRKRKYKKAKPDEREDPWLPSIPEVLFGTSGHYRTWLNGKEQSIVEEANAAFMRRFGYLEKDND